MGILPKISDGSARRTCYYVDVPTVLRVGPYRFHFYSRENREPPHVHVARDDLEVKFWLEPISVARNFGFDEPEVNVIRRLVEKYCQELIAAYAKFHEK